MRTHASERLCVVLSAALGAVIVCDAGAGGDTVAPASRGANNDALHVRNLDVNQPIYVRVPDSPGLEPQQFTIEFLFRGDGIGTGSDGSVLIAKPREGAAGTFLSSWVLLWSPTSQRIGAQVAHAFNSTGTIVSQQSFIPTGTVAHVALTFDGLALRLYINGQLDASAIAAASNVYYGAEDVLIGAGNYTSTTFARRANAMMDEVRIWNYVRTQQEIAGSWGSCVTYAPGTPGLLANWTFTDGSLADSSGNAHNGAPVGAVAFEAQTALGPGAQIVQQPTPITVCPDEPASFSVAPAAQSGVTYQWRKNGSPIDPLSNPTAATNQLQISSCQLDDIGVYDCVVSSACGSVESNPATLLVKVTPGDADGNGTVSFADITSVLANLGATCH